MPSSSAAACSPRGGCSACSFWRSKDDLWLALARHADDAAKELARALREKGYPFYAEPYTNQLFPILPDEKIRELERDFSFELNARVDETHTAVRFVTSWATLQETLEALVRAL